MPDPFLVLKPKGKVCGNKRWVKLVGLQETYASAAMTFLLTSMIGVCCLHSKL